jgi:hypothetical protein
MSYNNRKPVVLGAKNQLMQKAEGEAGSSRLPELPSAAEIKALRNVIRKSNLCVNSYICP